MNKQVPLSQTNVDRYHEEGFLLPGLDLPGTVLASIRESYEKISQVNDIKDYNHVLAPHIGNHAGNKCTAAPGERLAWIRTPSSNS